MTNLAFLVSGNGGNLKFINEGIKSSLLSDFSISFVIADRDCGALEYAKHEKIKSFLMPYSKSNSHELRLMLKELQSDLIITNIHKILDVEIVNWLKGKLINLHYSLLPSFKGLIGELAVKRALEEGHKVIGTTVHFVEERVDEGKIICQCSFEINERDSFQKLMRIVFKSGCLNLLNSIFVVLNKNNVSKNSVITVDEVPLLYSPELIFDYKDFDTKFWTKIMND